MLNGTSPPALECLTQVALECRLQILIVGAGLGGLAASISCARAGHSVTILESSKTLTEIGAGIQVTPNATRILQQWGVLDILPDSWVCPRSCTVHRYSDGHILAHEDDFDRNIMTKYQAPFLDMFRADLQHALVQTASGLGVTIKLNTKAEKVDFSSGTVTAASGEKHCADLVVGADGLWSQCRENFLGAKDDPRPTGDIAFRLLIRCDELNDAEMIRWIGTPELHFWIGPGAHVVGYPIKGGTMYNFVLLVPDNLPPGVSKQSGTVEEMKELLKDWDPFLRKLVSVARSEGVSKWKLMHREELPTWVHAESKFALIGDSCHPMLPYLAQGANSSIEDGAVLGGLLSHLTTKKQLPQALSMFQSLRKQRSEAIVRETFKQRHDFHMDDGPEQAARDALFLRQLGKKEIAGPFPSRWTCPEVQSWLYGYDAAAEVEAAIKEDPLDE